MSAIKRYIESQASLTAMEYGLKDDDVVDEIISNIVDRGLSTDDSIQATRAKFDSDAVPIQLDMLRKLFFL